MKYHPDRNPGNVNVARIMAIINTSYEVLSDPIMRRRHDDWIREAESVSEAPTPPSATTPPDDVPPSPPAPTPRPDNTRPPGPSTRYRTANPPASTAGPNDTPGLDRAQKGIIALVSVVLVIICFGVYGSSSEDGHQISPWWSSTAPAQPLPATAPTFAEFLKIVPTAPSSKSMSKQYQVGDTTYEFPDNFTDDQVKGILSSQGIIRGRVPKSDPSKAPIVPFDSSLVPIPHTGVIRALWPQGSETVLAPLNVVTSRNGPNYYIKMVNVQGGEPTLLFFVRSGETASVKIPTGTYIFKYASGERWHGNKYLFGRDTHYGRLGEKFALRVEGDRVLGRTIELIEQAAGNLRDVAISPQEF